MPYDDILLSSFGTCGAAEVNKIYEGLVVLDSYFA